MELRRHLTTAHFQTQKSQEGKFGTVFRVAISEAHLQANWGSLFCVPLCSSPPNPAQPICCLCLASTPQQKSGLFPATEEISVLHRSSWESQRRSIFPKVWGSTAKSCSCKSSQRLMKGNGPACPANPDRKDTEAAGTAWQAAMRNNSSKIEAR